MAQSLLGRIGLLVRANLNAALDEAEDPERALDQIVRDYSASIAEAEAAVAQTIASLRLIEDDHREAAEAVTEWGQKALAASRKADALRAQGQTAEADRFDGLARTALRRQLSFEDQAKTLETQVAQQRELTDKLKAGLDKLRLRRDELVRKRNELVSRSKAASAQIRVNEALNSASGLDPARELSRFEDRVLHAEARAGALEEVAGGSLEAQLAEIDADQDEQEVESRFARLKGTHP